MSDAFTSFIAAQQALDETINGRAPDNPKLYALAGSQGGVVAISDRPGFIYARINGDATRTVMVKLQGVDTPNAGDALLIQKQRTDINAPYVVLSGTSVRQAVSVNLSTPVQAQPTVDGAVIAVNNAVTQIQSAASGWNLAGFGQAGWGDIARPKVIGKQTQSVTVAASQADDHYVQADLVVDPAASNRLSVGASGVLVTQTPVSKSDTSTVAITLSGTDGHAIQADVKRSATAGNLVAANADGLYVPPVATSLGYTPANQAGDTFGGLVTVNGGSVWTTSAWTKMLKLNGTGALELGAGGSTMYGQGVSRNRFHFCYATTETNASDSAHYLLTLDTATLTNFAKLAQQANASITGNDTASNTLLVTGAGGQATDILKIAKSDGTGYLQVSQAGNVRIGQSAPSTTATDGFTYIPAVAGTPTGVPTAFTGFLPVAVDGTNSKFYFYSGGWKTPLMAETPLSKTDTSTIAITLSGTNNYTISAAAKLSATAGNQVAANADGLYVPKGAGLGSNIGQGVRLLATISGNVNISNTTQTPIPFDTEHFDSNNFHDTVTNTTRITFPVGGRYLVGGCVWWPSGSGGIRQVAIRLNGGSELHTDRRNGNNSTNTVCQPVTLYSFNANDYVELVCFQDSGGTVALNLNSPFAPSFWATAMS